MSVKLISLSNPLRDDRVEQEIPAGQSIRDIYFGLATGYVLSQCRCQVDGAIITDFEYIPPDGSTVTIKVVPLGGGGDGKAVGSILGGVLAVFGAVISIASAGMLTPVGALLIGTGVSLILSGTFLLLYEPPDLPQFKSNTPQTRPGLQGAKNQPRPYGYVPVLFGRSLLTPDMAAGYYISILNNEQYLTQLFCAGYANMSIELDSFKLGDTKLVELSVTKDIQAILSGGDPVIQMELLSDGSPSTLYPRRVKQIQVSRPLKQTLDDGTSGAVIVTTPADTTKIDLNFTFNSGLFGINDSGDVVSVGIRILLWIKPADAPDSQYLHFGYINGSNSDLWGSSKKSLFRAFSAPVTSGAWTVKVEHGGALGSATHRYDDCFFATLNAFQDGPPVSPDAAKNIQLIALKVKATDRINGVIDNFNFIAQAVVPVYSGNGSGPSAWEPALTRNPAAALLYALQGPINRRTVDDAYIDWKTLEAWFLWCDTYRYFCSAVLSNKTTLMELLKQICFIGRAEPVRKDGRFSVIQDIIRPVHFQLITPKNSIDYSQTLGFPYIPQALEMQFVDETSGFKEDVRKVFNTPTGEQEDSDPSDFQGVVLWGVTDARQAFLLGRYQYACLLNRPRVHTIILDFEYLTADKGQWIKYSGDTAMSGIAWGRIKEVIQTGSVITALVLDEMVQMEEGKSYRIRIRTAQNNQGEYAVIYRPEYTNYLLLDEPIPISFGAAVENLYAFGETGLVTLDLLIVDIEPVSMDQARLKCVDYAPEIFGVDMPNYVIPPWNPNVSVGGALDSGIPETPPPAYLHQVQEKIVEIQIDVTERPTYTELVNGFARAGTTVIPAVLTLAAAGGFRFISLTWTKQTNLSNLKEYQVQVSEDAVTWYAPRFDGQGLEEATWRGEENGVFATVATMVVHPNISPAGSAHAPAGRFLYYRVRQRTMLDAYSDWSAVIGAETKLTDTGDYGTNSISANALKTAELLAMFAKLTESLIVDPRYGISSENSEWSDGDTRAVLNARQIAFQFFMDQVWVTMARLGLEGVEATQLYSPDKLFIT
ncbi:MAG: hypothetical protein FWG29_01710, partial [Treponema sp.]|nr:hypothetical protein [Treponema sp.]